MGEKYTLSWCFIALRSFMSALNRPEPALWITLVAIPANAVLAYALIYGAFGLPELYHLGSLLFRRGLTGMLREGLDEGSWTDADAARIAGLIGVENARRVYDIAAQSA